MKVTILGLSITSSWGNGHATNFRALGRALQRRGDQVVFLERDQPWYAQHRDLPSPPWCTTMLYDSPAQLQERYAPLVAGADLVIVGSFVPDGVAVADWVLEQAGGTVAFYDIDTPVTLEKLRSGDGEYINAELVERFDLYLSFTAGPVLDALSSEFGARRPEPFYCFVDPIAYAPVEVPRRYSINYLGTYSEGRQAALCELLLQTARRLPDERFSVAGPMYPAQIEWPANVERIDHLPPGEHPAYYCAAEFTLNVTRAEMRAVGYSPSVRLFEAAACGVPIISDVWPGIETVLEPEREILLARDGDGVLGILSEVGSERRDAIRDSARRRVLAEHTGAARVRRLHELVLEGAAR